jgi:hypothetical protein
MATTFSKRDFYELADGTVRVTRPLTSHLALTRPQWRKPAETVAGWFAACLSPERVLPIRLPELESRQAGGASGSPRKAVARGKRGQQSHTPPNGCLESGRALSGRQARFCSKACHFAFNRAETGSATPALTTYRASGDDRSHSGAAAEKRRDTNRRKALQGHAWKGSRTQLAALREWYAGNVAPAIVSVAPAKIRAATGLSECYITLIRRGTVPHPIHFAALAGVAGVIVPEELGVRVIVSV